MASTSMDEESIDQTFEHCEKFITQFEEGKLSTEETKTKIQKIIEKLDLLTKDIQILGLFGENEFFEELPTSSVKMFLVPCYKAICYQNLPFEPTTRFQQLKNAKLNYMDFLQRLHSYEVIRFALPWNVESEEMDVEEIKISRPSGDELRKEKLRRLDYDRNLKGALERAKEDYAKNPDNDTNLREIYLMQLRQWALRSLSELEQIENELPLAKRMIDPASSKMLETVVPNHPPKLKPFILTRTAAQKKVFGLGYPAIPTVTVDEWAKGMVDQGHWGSSPSGQQPTNSNPDEEEDSESEERRQQQIRMDDYKDTHRRGWGNTHNKG